MKSDLPSKLSYEIAQKISSLPLEALKSMMDCIMETKKEVKYSYQDFDRVQSLAFKLAEIGIK